MYNEFPKTIYVFISEGTGKLVASDSMLDVSTRGRRLRFEQSLPKRLDQSKKSNLKVDGGLRID